MAGTKEIKNQGKGTERVYFTFSKGAFIKVSGEMIKCMVLGNYIIRQAN